MPLLLGAEPPLPSETISISLNGPNDLALERWKIRELMEGFPVHRDACEWSKMRQLFAKENAYVFTTWSGGVPIDDFIKISEQGFYKGARIAHRVNGATVDIATSGLYQGRRALGKLKASITQRFKLPCTSGGECEVDIEADCRLCFFMEKYDDGWKNHFFKGIYEKDAIRSVLPHRIPVIDEEHLTTFPYGYRNLAYGQSGIPNAPPIKLDLPQSEGEEHDRFYESFLHWLKGASIAEMKVELGV